MNEQVNRGHDDKMKFDGRKSAKTFLRKMRIKNQHPYRCTVCRYWHLGHLPHDVRFGAQASSAFTPLPHGGGHTSLHTNSAARERAHELLFDENWKEIVAARVVAQIAFVQRTKQRNPSLREAAELGGEYWQAVGEPPAGWRSTPEDWRAAITNATMIALARASWITLDSRGRDVRIGHAYERMLNAA